jgi:hypothetical protein
VRGKRVRKLCAEQCPILFKGRGFGHTVWGWEFCFPSPKPLAAHATDSSCDSPPPTSPPTLLAVCAASKSPKNFLCVCVEGSNRPTIRALFSGAVRRLLLAFLTSYARWRRRRDRRGVFRWVVTTSGANVAQKRAKRLVGPPILWPLIQARVCSARLPLCVRCVRGMAAENCKILFFRFAAPLLRSERCKLHVLTPACVRRYGGECHRSRS